MIAIICGGAECIYTDLMETAILLGANELDYSYFAVNDVALKVATVDHWITLHPEKLRIWWNAREKLGFPMPPRVWAHTADRHVTDVEPEHWGGSSGLFAVRIALKLGYTKIILNGVPMTREGGHIIRGVPWGHCAGFTAAWQTHAAELAPFVRSWSGWTADLFGRPDAAWIKGV